MGDDFGDLIIKDEGVARKAGRWAMPAMAVGVVWALLACGYTFSGIDKLSSPSWVDGQAIPLLLDNPLARPGFIRDSLLLFPDWVLHSMTWGSMEAEILFLPLYFFQAGRMVAWASMLAMHLGIMVLISFADLSMGMIMIHIFTFDRRWLPMLREWWLKAAVAARLSR